MYKYNRNFHFFQKCQLSDTNDVPLDLITVFYLNIKYIILHICNKDISTKVTIVYKINEIF